jgi:VCBS repeat-containing protein
MKKMYLRFVLLFVTAALTSIQAEASTTLFAEGMGAPIAVNDEAFGPEDIPLSGDLSENDSDPDGDALTYSVVSISPNVGTLMLNPDGSYDYVPQAEFVGFVYVTYEVCDPGGSCAQAQLELAFIFVNDLPVVYDDVFYGEINSLLSGNVVANDVDIDIEPIFSNVLLAPSVGTLALSTNGNFTYTPPANFTGTVTFMYQGCDPCGACDQGLVTLYITPPNQPPVANDDDTFTSEDGSVSGSVASNDTDPENMTLLYSLMMGASHGNLVFNANGSYSYQPDLDWYGMEVIQYQVCDPYGDCDQANLMIEVLFVNDPPIAVDDIFNINEDQVVNGYIGGNDIEYDDEMLLYQVINGVPSGTLNLFNDGYFTYIPAANYSGTVTILIMAIDPCGVADFSDLVFNIQAVNDAPMAYEDENETWEDNTVSGSVAGNDSDAEPGVLTYSVINGPESGELLFLNDGSYTYTPEPNFTGYLFIDYEVCDAQGLCAQSLLMISVMLVNDAPVAEDDEYTTQEDVPVNGTVATNDYDVDEDNLTYSIVSGPSSGTFVLNPNGTFSFTPALDANGVFTITYMVTDIEMATSTAVLTIVVTGVNDALEVINDSYTVNEDNTLTGDLSDNDVDPEGDVLTYTLVSSPVNGPFNLSSNGSFTYTPTANYNGTFSLTYQACDAPNSCETATVSITVNAVNDAPNANNDSFNGNEDQTITGTVATNDSDFDSSNLTYTVSTAPISGTLTMNANGSFTYVPAANYFGAVMANYQVCDGGGLCDNASITFNVQSVNDLPVASNDSFSVNEDGVLSNTVATNDSDIETASLTFSVESQPSNGVLVLNSNGTFTFTPTANYFGTVTFTYNACDAQNACDEATVTITVSSVNDAPVAVNDALNLLEDGVLSGTIATNDSDLDGDALTYTVLAAAEHGTFTLNANGTFSYTPSADYSGSDEITYQACDPSNACDQATVLISVVATNDSPVAQNESFGMLFNQSVNGNVSTNDTDPDGDALTFSVLANVEHGTLTFNANGTFTFTPDDLYVGNDQFTYAACDPNGICDNAVVTLNITSNNEAPVAMDDEYITLEEGEFTANVGDNDTDENMIGWTFSIVNMPAHGSLTMQANGMFTYIPVLDYWGPDAFTYEVCDVFGVCDQGEVNFTVEFVNDAPVAVDEYENVMEDGVLQGNVWENEIEVDLEMLLYQIIDGPDHGTIEFFNDGYYTYTPDENYFGDDAITYLACDPCGVCDVGVLYIEVDFVNDLPMAVNDYFNGLSDQVLTGSVATNDIELDPEILTYGTMDAGVNGVFTLSLNGDFTFLPNEGWFGTETFQYMACDPCGACSVATLTITIEQPNTAPSAAGADLMSCMDTVIEIPMADYIADAENTDDELIISDAQVEEGMVVIDNFNHMLVFSPNAEFSGVAVVSYTICDEEGACASAQFNVNVMSSSAPQIVSSNVTNVSCYGENNGAISLEVSGEGLIVCTWNGEMEGPSLENLSQGVYAVTVTDEAACGSMTTMSFEVTAPEAPLTVEGEVILWVGISEETYTVSGGTAPYSYSWTNNAGEVVGTTDTFTSGELGVYMLTVTDDNDCTTSIEVTFVNSVTEFDNGTSSLTVWPNPADDQVYVQMNGNDGAVSEIVVTDIAGREIIRQYIGVWSAGRILTLDTAPWAAGAYNVSVITDSSVMSTPLVIH